MATAPASLTSEPQRNFRFFDNRQKYLLFVTTCSEKWVVAHRVGLELANIHPRPPSVRLFDAGVGDGTVLARVMRSMHDRFPAMPFYVVGKEISLEDVRLTLQKVADRFVEHPATVLVLTNLAYADAPWLAVKSVSAASSLVWHEVPLAGTTAHKFESQITDLEPFLSAHWHVRVNPASGSPVYEKPVVLVIYRKDYRLLLDSVKVRLFADVPVGALLSAGIDSTLICWAMSKLNADIKSYTVGAPGDPADESATTRIDQLRRPLGRCLIFPS